MNTTAFSEWLGTLSLASRIAALAGIYSNLTVGARQMFMPEWTVGKERYERALEILHGLNEIHHTISNQLLAYATDECNARPIHVFGRALSEIETRYRLENFLAPAVQFAQSNTAVSREPS
jgi:hypothetical protein